MPSVPRPKELPQGEWTLADRYVHVMSASGAVPFTARTVADMAGVELTVADRACKAAEGAGWLVATPAGYRGRRSAAWEKNR